MVVATAAIFLQAKAARVPCSCATQVSANAGLRKNGPVPSGCACNQAMRRCSSFIWNHQTSLLAPRLKRLLLVPGLISGSNAAIIQVLTGPSRARSHPAESRAAAATRRPAGRQYRPRGGYGGRTSTCPAPAADAAHQRTAPFRPVCAPALAESGPLPLTLSSSSSLGSKHS